MSTRAAGRHGQSTTYGKTHRTTDGRQVFIGVQEMHDAHGKERGEVLTVGKVEMNPSKVHDPSSWQLAGVEAVAPAIAFAAEVAHEALDAEAPPDEWKVSRIDVARDFDGVANPSRLLRGLAPIHRPWAKRNLVHADPTKYGAQTLMVGSGAGVVRAYDKCAETGGKAPEGTLRWEAEARKGWSAQYGGIATVADINPTSALALAWNRWNWSAMGVTVSATSRVVEKVARAEGLSEREKAQFIGWLFMAAADFHWEVGSKTTLAKYRRLQRELGVALSPDDLDGEGEGLVSHLDFATGREIVTVAA